MIHKKSDGVPEYSSEVFLDKRTKYCLLIPIINEGERIKAELNRALKAGINTLCDIIICDGGSTDGSTDKSVMNRYGVRALLTKLSEGRQGAQLRMGISWALNEGYKGVITIDGNNKDSVENVRDFIIMLDEGMDFVQGSRFVRGGKAVNTPLSRYLAVRLIHAPVISLTARHKFTDTTNAFRAYSRKYLTHPEVCPLREIFSGYELLAYLSVKASRLGLNVCEIPVTREYPKKGKTPTKISGIKGSADLFKILFNNLRGKYNVNQ